LQIYAKTGNITVIGVLTNENLPNSERLKALKDGILSG